MWEPTAAVYLAFFSFLSFYTRFRPTTIFNVEVSMVIGEMHHQRRETGKESPGNPRPARAESLPCGQRIHEKKNRTMSIFPSLPGFRGGGGGSMCYAPGSGHALNCRLSESVPSSPWYEALRFLHHTLLHSRLPPPHL